MAGLMRSANILLLSAMSAVVLLSCGGSGDEPAPDPVNPQPKESPIVFSGNLSEGQSESHARTRTPLSSTHQTFHVWAYKNPATGSTETVMKNYTVNWISGSEGSTASNSSGWEYVNLLDADGFVQSIKYWDFTASDYRFFGYTGTGVTPAYSISTDSDHPCVRLSFDVDAPTANLSDLTGATLFSKLWCKTGTAIASDIKPVQLEFLQPCVKVRFLFKQSAASDVYFYKKDIEFKPTDDSKKIVTGGRFTVTYPLTGNTTKESWSVETGAGIATSATIDALTQADDAPSPAVPVFDDGVWYQVLPALNQGSYILLVKINNEPREVVVPGEYMNWQPGFEYTYIFKITDSGGVTFDGLEVVKITSWTKYDDNREVYNW